LGVLELVHGCPFPSTGVAYLRRNLTVGVLVSPDPHTVFERHPDGSRVDTFRPRRTVEQTKVGVEPADATERLAAHTMPTLSHRSPSRRRRGRRYRRGRVSATKPDVSASQ
jgi:hypothetical protein